MGFFGIWIFTILRRKMFYYLLLPLISFSVSEEEYPVVVTPNVRDLINQESTLSEQFFLTLKVSGTTGTTVTGGCLLGSLLAPGIGTVLGCSTGTIIGAIISYLSAKSYANDLEMRADVIWEEYRLSHQRLVTALGSGGHKEGYRFCAKMNHPDKRPKDLEPVEVQNYEDAWNDCQFAVQFIEAFQEKYGKEKDKKKFEEKFAGFWHHLFHQDL